VTVILTNAGCTPDRAGVAAGPVSFRIVNDGADAVSEVELDLGGRILGEKENLAPGMSGSFTLDLDAGDYALACPGAATPTTPFEVTAAPSARPSMATTGLLDRAAADYADYVRGQADALVTATRAFSHAVLAGDAARARMLYGPARVFYERIEPVAETFGDLDRAIDGRIDDAPSPADFTGFHRLEEALWKTGDLDGVAAIARKLDDDVEKLAQLVATETYQPVQLANGAAELLDEVAQSKVTGEEERYSHLDLLDFQANLVGARQAFDLLEPALAVTDPTLATLVAQRFEDVQQALDRYRSGDGFVAYTLLSTDQTRALAQEVDALAEPLSRVAAALVSP
jgi:iron uptake system component EfeO